MNRKRRESPTISTLYTQRIAAATSETKKCQPFNIKFQYYPFIFTSLHWNIFIWDSINNWIIHRVSVKQNFFLFQTEKKQKLTKYQNWNKFNGSNLNKNVRKKYYMRRGEHYSKIANVFLKNIVIKATTRPHVSHFDCRCFNTTLKNEFVISQDGHDLMRQSWTAAKKHSIHSQINTNLCNTKCDFFSNFVLIIYVKKRKNYLSDEKNNDYYYQFMGDAIVKSVVCTVKKNESTPLVTSLKSFVFSFWIGNFNDINSTFRYLVHDWQRYHYFCVWEFSQYCGQSAQSL